MNKTNKNATKHGHTSRVKNKKGKVKVIRSITYNSWRAMNERCYNPKQKYWDDYGGRGITVCARWRAGNPEAFKSFLADMGVRPNKEMTLDRKDVNGNYCKTNCRWADKSTQRTNQRWVIDLKDLETVNPTTMPF